jgi:hypothetical protein
MTRYTYHFEIDRIVIQGAGTDRLNTTSLLSMTQAAIEAELTSAPLPAGRTMRESLRVNAPSVAAGTESAIARAVGQNIARAAGGGPSHG